MRLASLLFRKETVSSPSASLAGEFETAVATSGGVVADDRGTGLFRLGRRLREADGAGWWRAKVVDEELLAQGAPEEIVLQAVRLHPNLSKTALSQALEPCLFDHPRVQLCHSVALPPEALKAIQPSEPSPLLPPLYWLPICRELNVAVLVKEWSDGIALPKWAKGRGRELALVETLDVFDTVCEALGGFHRRGFRHGALTPDSIALQEWSMPAAPGEPLETVWIPKLVDIGLVRSLAGESAPRGEASKWCAPEAFDIENDIDWRRCDQWSVAAILASLWTGEEPFEPMESHLSASEAQARRRARVESLRPLRANEQAKRLGVTPAMSAACERAMSVDPADRFPSLGAFAAALRIASREFKERNGEPAEPNDVTQMATAAGVPSAKFRVSTSAQSLVPAPRLVDASTQVAQAPQQRLAEQSTVSGFLPDLKPSQVQTVMGYAHAATPVASEVSALETAVFAPPVLEPPLEAAGATASLAHSPEQSSETKHGGALAEAMRGEGPWAVNRLVLVLGALWILTLAWGLSRGG